MKKLLLVFVIVMLIAPATSFAYIVNVDLPIGGNAFGLAVGPNGHVYLTTSHSYVGTNNFYEYDTSGNLINSTRIPFVTNMSVSLGAIDFLDDGSIIGHATMRDQVTATSYIYTCNADGSNPALQYSTDMWPYGLSYASSGPLFLSYSELINPLWVGEYYSYINMFTVDGTYLSQFLVRYNREISGIAYNPDSDSLFVTYLDNQLFMEEYVKDGNGDYQFSQAYDLSGVLDRHAMALDYKDGLFYALFNNEGFSVFSLNDLTMIDPPDLYESPLHDVTVPVPGAAILLGSGLIGLAGLRKKFRS